MAKFDANYCLGDWGSEVQILSLRPMKAETWLQAKSLKNFRGSAGVAKPTRFAGRLMRPVVIERLPAPAHIPEHQIVRLWRPAEAAIG